jgi:hypothetical protein
MIMPKILRMNQPARRIRMGMRWRYSAPVTAAQAARTEINTSTGKISLTITA